MHYVMYKEADGNSDPEVLFAGSRDKAIGYYEGFVDAIQRMGNHTPDFRLVKDPDVDLRIARIYFYRNDNPGYAFHLWVKNLQLPHSYKYQHKE